MTANVGPPGEVGRPLTQGAATDAHTPTSASIAPLPDRAVERICEILRRAAARDLDDYLALVALYKLGVAAGYADGHAAAEAAMRDAWHRVWVKVRATLDQPTYAELRRRRGEAA